MTEGHIREGFYHFEWARNWLGPRAHEHGSAGSFSLEARPEGDSIIAGKGWNPGLYDRNITYSGFYEVITSPDSGNSSASAISVYGWTRDLPVEYQIVESYSGGYSPGGDKKGTVTCNGASYDVFQFYSIQNPPRMSHNGTIGSDELSDSFPTTVQVACHFNAWRDDFDMHLGASHHIQLVAAEVEGYGTTIRAAINVVDPEFTPIEVDMLVVLISEGPRAQAMQERVERKAR
ncbi:hypothetical protein AAF712_015058 [Marasmius tenuissimus]|uniref:endo-1,4-beta-xylanase n=1 Tax=Marasmius tenuissimus TaxID=585030 RepID=A0ABR2ZA88_9AGAR